MDVKVSVIIPAYNTEEYMGECLESILKQTLKEIEIIVVDDGSTDGTLPIIQTFSEKHPDKIKVFHKENGGQASARNLALSYAKGEYLGFVDSDDWVDEDMYEKLYLKAKEENADIVICDMIEHFPNQQIYHNGSKFDDKFAVTPSACNKIFRSSFAGEIKFPVGLWYEDFEYTTKQLMKTDKISVIHEGLYHYYCREVSTMHNNNAKKNKDILEVMAHLEQFMHENDLVKKYSKALEYIYIDHVLLTTINRIERQKCKGKRVIIRCLRKEIWKKYPYFYRDEIFKKFALNRRIVACLNAVGLSYMSKLIFDIKNIMIGK